MVNVVTLESIPCSLGGHVAPDCFHSVTGWGREMEKEPFRVMGNLPTDGFGGRAPQQRRRNVRITAQLSQPIHVPSFLPALSPFWVSDQTRGQFQPPLASTPFFLTGVSHNTPLTGLI